jgi:hypothetical protein
MKLWIDDIRTPPDDSWHICRDVSSAIRALDMFWPEVTDINLDHDISHQIVMGMSRPFPCTETFEAVARFIAMIKRNNGIRRESALQRYEGEPEWTPGIRLHTSNTVGAYMMRNILEDVGLGCTIELAKGANRLETIL